MSIKDDCIPKGVQTHNEHGNLKVGIYTKKQIEEMDLETAQVEIEQAVYNAALLFERLEGVKKVHGNGHHMAQRIAAQAKELLVERWIVESKSDLADG